MTCPSSTRELLDIATRLAISAKSHRVEGTQVRRLLELVESLGSSRDALLIVMAHVLRQSGRKVIDFRFANEFIDEFKRIYGECGDGAGSVAHDILKYMDWIYDGIERLRLDTRNVRSFMDLVNNVTGSGGGSRQ